MKNNSLWYLIIFSLLFSCNHNSDQQKSVNNTETKDQIKRYNIDSEELIQNHICNNIIVELNDVKKGSQITASVKVKNNNFKGGLVISGKNNVLVRIPHNNLSKNLDNQGYETIHYQTTIKRNLKDNFLKVYVDNETNDSVYYKDLHVEINPDPNKPKEDTTIEAFKLKIDDQNFQKIKSIRDKALKKGMIVKGDDDWAKASIIMGNHEIPCVIRLKGDWLDHIEGKKWSFRVKIKGDYSWNRMKEFSIQKPEIRGFLYEWLYHKLLEQEDVLTTRYGFMPVELNGEKLGLYAYEEHFVKQLLEYRKRKEAPILKYDESGLWDKFSYPKDLNLSGLNIGESIEVKAFKTNKTNKKPNLRSAFEIGQTYLNQLKKNEVKVSEVCNVSDFAKFIAISQLCRAQHGQIWHNMRLYINPVSGLIEPIAYDGFWGNYNAQKTPFFLWQNNLSCIKTNTRGFHMPFFMDDSLFVKEYNRYLNKYVNKNFTHQFLTKHNDELQKLNALINDEYNMFYFDQYYLISNVDSLQDYKNKFNSYVSENCFPKIKVYKKKYTDCEHLSPKQNISLRAYSEVLPGNNKKVYVTNYFCRDLKIQGFGNAGTLQYILPKSVIINRFEETEAYIELTSPSQFNNIIYSTVEGDTLFSIPISKFPIPKKIEPRKKLASFKNNIYKYASVSKKNIVFKKGSKTINRPLYIPKGYNVKFEQGCKLDFIKSSFFFSESPIQISGTKSDSIIITSSDKTSRSFTVQSQENSKVNYCRISGFNAFELDGWTLPGSVNFYLGNVTLENTIISDNLCEDALNIVSSTFSLNECKFISTWGDAFDADFSKGTIENCNYTNIGNDAMDFSTSEIDISNCTVVNCGDKGLSGGEQSTLTVNNLIVTYANIGIASKDLSNIQVNNTTIEGCKYGVMLYRKKPEYGSATINMKNSKTKSVIYKNYTQAGSHLTVDGIKETEFKIIPKEIFK